MDHYLIYGAGGHARVIADLLKACDLKPVAFIDDNPSMHEVDGVPVKEYNPQDDVEAGIVIGIGNNTVRKKIAASLSHQPAVLIHPRAVVAADVIPGAGTVILANAVVQTGASIGKHVIINAGVCVDHDAVIEDYVHLYPNVYIGGGARIKAGVTINAGTCIPRNTVVEAGPGL
jgi:sugar O-acyltransferase (sialic acid O-acetyltransferase NeuD family)